MKEKQSKLDPFASQIEYWFGTEKKTLAEVKAQLALDGCVVSEQRLSEWWSRRSEQLMRDKILAQITSGAQQVRDVEKQFAKDPPPELEMLIKLHRTLLLNLTTQAGVDPVFFKFVSSTMKPVMKWAELQEKKASRELDETKFKESMRKKLDAGMDELAKHIKGNAEARKAYEAFRVSISQATK